MESGRTHTSVFGFLCVFVCSIKNPFSNIMLKLMLLKVSKNEKNEKIRKRYNQVPPLTRDTIWESDKVR